MGSNNGTGSGEVKDGLVTFRTVQGVEVRGTVMRVSRFACAFEVYSPDTIIRISETLEDFKIFLSDRSVYAGRAVVRDCINTGTVSVCSVVLDDINFDVEFFTTLGQNGRLRERFVDFFQQWQKGCTILPGFKVAVADIETFLMDLRRWLEQVELGIRSSPRADGADLERSVIDNLSPQIIPIIDALFEKFEIIAAGLDEEASPVYRNYIQRHLHPIVLCAPFAYRSYQKPLGYAGDYEMVNMMLRNPQEGSSLFAKVFNVWLLHQGSAAAHRNRIEHLKLRLREEATKAIRAGRKVRILNIGCGSAWEVQEFLVQSELSNATQFTLIDFNLETLEHAAQVLKQRQQQFHRTASIDLVKKSIHQLLKEGARTSGSGDNKFDFIYCAGLFDYLPDRTCKRLLSHFYNLLSPGGLVLATNVAPLSPNRGSLELILDWHLIYRDAAQLRALLPEEVPQDTARVQSDETGVNVFVEARKPNDV